MPFLGPLLVTAAALVAGAPGIPGGMVSTDFQVAGGPAGGLDDVTYSTTVVAEPTRTSDHYFWADQFAFGGGHAGYIGLQPRPDAGGAPQGAAYFSVFGAGVTTSDPNCSQGADGSAGLSCHVSFPYEIGRTYHLTVTRSAPSTWTGSVADAAGGISTHIATWTVPVGWGLLAPTSSAFTEYYAKLPGGCDDVPYALVVNGPPVAQHGMVQGSVTGAKTYGGTSGAYVNCGAAQYAKVWRDAAGSHSETGLAHQPAASATPTPTAATSTAPPAKTPATPGKATKSSTTPRPSGSTSATSPAAAAPGAAAAPVETTGAPTSTAEVALSQAPVADSSSGTSMVLPIGLGTFAAVLVGVYFQWSKKHHSGRRRSG